MVGRLAPSPTGALHLGNARTFLLAWLSIRSRGGRLILRIEDLDHPKVKHGTTQLLLEDLRWLGLDWDEGPDCGGPHAPYIQSQRLDLYERALAVLKSQNLVYPCICSRNDVAAGQSAPHMEDDGPRYNGNCRNRYNSFQSAKADLQGGKLPAWRFLIQSARETEFNDLFAGKQRQSVFETCGDFVVARHASGAGYMLAVVVDDATMNVTEVLRGDDLLSATHRQLLIYKALGLQPPEFVHVPLVVGTDGRRLAKRHGDTRLATLRENGISSEKVIGLLGWWSGIAEFGEEITAKMLISRFDLKKLPRTQAVVDSAVAKLLGL